MVDSTKGLGPFQGISTTQKPSVTKRAEEQREAGNVQDTVEISPEALSAQEAEQAAKEARDALQRKEDVTLGLNPSFVNKTA